jgi:hypothetical protein
MGIEVVIGFIPGGSNQVEITQNSNRPIQRGIDVLNGSEKARFESVGARAIDIANREGSIVGKGGGDGKIINKSIVNNAGLTNLPSLA